MRSCLLFSLILIFSLQGLSQVVIDPPFPLPDDNITVYFDASRGNGELMGCECVVYAHAGLITDKSTSPTDWKYVQGNWGTDDAKVKMTRVGTDLYALSYNIRQFYSVPPTEQIRALAFVFRNANGSKVGRAADGSDIYYPMGDADSLRYVISTPELKDRIITPGTLFAFQAYTNVAASMQLRLNNAVIAMEENAGSLQFDSLLTQPGNYHFSFSIQSALGNRDTAFTWIIPDAPVIADVPSGARLGAHLQPDGTIRFLLDAPGKAYAFLYQVDGEAVQLNKSPDNRFFWIAIDTAGLGGTLKYQYWLEGDIQIPDPLSETILDPWNDSYITHETYPDLPEYPAGRASGLLSWLDWRSTYTWQQPSIVLPPPGRLIIYEVLIRDFLHSHSFAELTDSITYWKRLGINAVELMPVNEFEGNISWGYNPALHNAIDKYYGPADQLKAFIDKCHQEGIAVIADVVFNHAFGSNPMVRMYWDNVQHKPASGNPWFNADATHPFNVGFDFNHESEATQRYVVEVLRNMLEQFHFDGFRFDLSKGFTQRNTGSDIGAWGAYDASRIAILRTYRDAIVAIKPDAYVILEHFADNAEEKELAAAGFLLWGNLSHAYQEAVMGYPSDPGWGYYKNRDWSAPHLVTYMESHDEERLMYKALNFGNSNGDYNIRDLNTALERVSLASAFFYTLPGAKMLWQMGELGYDYSINYCEDGTISDNCRTGPKPIRWDYLQQAARMKLWGTTAALIALKKEFSAFDNADITSSLAGMQKQISMDEPDLKMLVLGNFDVRAGNMVARFPSNEMYYNYLGRDSIQGKTDPVNYILQPGEYKLYLNKKVDNPYLTLKTQTPFITGEIMVFPSLLNAGEVIHIRALELNNATISYTFYSNTGESVSYTHLTLPTKRIV